MQSISYDQLDTFLKRDKKETKLLMFDARWCPFCVGAASGISDAIAILNDYREEMGFQFRSFYRYIVDGNEIP
jgi:hypothetical protein